MLSNTLSDGVLEQAHWNPALRPNSETAEHHEDVSSNASDRYSINNNADSTANSGETINATKASGNQRPTSRHFAQSASIHQVPEPEEIEDQPEIDESVFEKLPQQGIDYTNSFPAVPQNERQTTGESTLQPQPLPRSQIEDIFVGNEKPVSGHSANKSIDWGNGLEEEDFLAEAAGGHHENALTTTEDTRFEEGLPLVQKDGEVTENVDSSIEWTEATVDDDFFGTASVTNSHENSSFTPRALDRKSTEQVLQTMQYPSHWERHPQEDLPVGHSGVALESVPAMTAEVATNDQFFSQEPDLAAAWSAALDDDEMLTENTSMDPSAFFEDDGEGFLDDTEPSFHLSEGQQVTQQQTGFTGNNEKFATVQRSQYVPPGAQSQYRSTQDNTMTAGRSSIPEPTRALSFADKAKGGYESPYDLPMNIRPKRQTASRQTPSHDPSNSQMPSRGSPNPPSNFGNAKPADAKPNPSSKHSTFFEELPMVVKPTRASNVAKVAPNSQAAAASAMQDPYQQGSRTNLSQNEYNHGLVMPSRQLSFGDDGTRLPQAQESQKATSRYSPVQTRDLPQTSTPPVQGRYSNIGATSNNLASAGPPRTSSASFTQPFQPRTSSPLARSTSISDEQRITSQIPKDIGASGQIYTRGMTSTPPQLSPPTVQASLQTPDKQTPAYQAGTVVRHRRAPSLIKQYSQPNDERAQDPLERWKGGPIFKFGTAGIVSSFPIETPRFSVGSTQPMYIVNPGEVKLRSAKTIPAAEESVLAFPGPLKNKGKKKDLLSWLNARVEILKQQILHPEVNLNSDLARQRREDRVSLMQVISALVEFDGNLDASPAVTALRNILSPTVSNDNQQMSTVGGSESLVGITRSNTAPPSRATDVEAVEQVRQLLLAGDREKAVWHAVDKDLWGHAMLISSTIQGETWKQVVHEFVRNEVKPCGNNTEALSALFDVFSGNLDECVDQLVPAAARSGFQMVSSTGTTSVRNALAGLDKWQETLALIISNRTIGDKKAMITLGELLASYGRTEAAHVCYIVARSPGLLAGLDDSSAHAVLLGANHHQRFNDIHRDMDALLATEAYEFAINILSGGQSAQPMHYLVPYKLYHATLLADCGRREEAQAYCEIVTASIKSNKMSPYLHPQLLDTADDLSTHLSQALKESNKSWLGNPKMGDVSNSLLNRFNKFVSGDDSDAASTASGPTGEVAPFGGVGGEPISISRTASPSLAAGGYAVQSVYTPATQIPGSSSRYAPTAPSYSSSPASSYAPQHRDSSSSLPRMSPDHFRRTQPSAYQTAGVYTPTSGLASELQSSSQAATKNISGYVANSLPADSLAVTDSRPGTSDGAHTIPALQGRRTSYGPLSVVKPAVRDRNSQAYQPRSSGLESRSSSYAPRSSSFAPRTYAPSPATSDRQLDENSRQSSGSYVPQAPLIDAHGSATDDSNVSARAVLTSVSTKSGSLTEVDRGADYKSEREAAISFGDYNAVPAPMVGDVEQPANETGDHTAPSQPSYGQNYEPPANNERDVGMEFQPMTFGYEPPRSIVQTSEINNRSSIEEEAEKPKTKVRGIMDLSDEEDNLPPRSTVKNPEEKARKDRETDDAFRRAAEEDAKRDQAAKNAPRGSWFGGWLGGKKRDSSTGPEPTVHKAKLGEESSFVYDESLKKWVNKKAGAEAATEQKATPPPPRGGPPSRSGSVGPPPAGPPRSIPPGPPNGLVLGPSATPPSRTSSPLVNITTTAEKSTPPQLPTPNASSAASAASTKDASSVVNATAPPSRPGTGMSGVSNASSIDDLLGGPPTGTRKGAAAKRGKKGRYVDVMAK